MESKRIRAAVEWGGPIHYTFQEDWLHKLGQDKLYLWPFLDSMVYAHHVKDVAELREQAPTLSLKTQGWLNKTAAPILTLNGTKDPWITIQDLYILLESGEPKAARVFPEDATAKLNCAFTLRIRRIDTYLGLVYLARHEKDCVWGVTAE